MLHIEGWKRVVIWATCALGLLFALPNGFYRQVESYNDAQEAGHEPTGWPSFLRSVRSASKRAVRASWWCVLAILNKWIAP